MLCPSCGRSNVDPAQICSACGVELTHDAAPTREQLLQAVLGEKNQNYYLKRFFQFDQQGKAGISWHWPACFVTLYWLLYRKMWLNALFYMFLPSIIMIPMAFLIGAAGKWGEALILPFYGMYAFSLFLLPALYGNALYYRHCNMQIADVRRRVRDPHQQLRALAPMGGVSRTALILLLVLFVGISSIMAAIAIPAYEDYTTRARITQGWALGQKATHAVTIYRMQIKRIPPRLEETSFSAVLPAYIREMGVDPLSSVIHVTLGTGPVAGKSLLFVPALDAGQVISWTCLSKDIHPKYLPHQCRHVS